MVPVSLQVNPLPIVNLTVAQAISCAASANGAISTSISGATGPFSFDWNINALDGQQNPANLGPGTYSVVVTATTTGCMGTGDITLSAPTAITLNCAQQNPVSSIGGSDGSATVQISGGTAAYTVAWSGPASGSQNQATAGTATITGLISGIYNILVTDANGCTQTCSFTINSPNCNLSATAVGTNPGCNGAATGSIALTVTGGTGALTFDWNDNTLDGTEDPTGLSAGTYSVTITDGAGCMATASVTLTNPAALVLVCAQQNPVSSIGGSDGSATVQISGGTVAYTVAWSGAASGSQNQATAGTATITGLIAGIYNILVTDANGCTQTCSFTITSPNCNLSAIAVGTNPGCNGAATGSIALTVTGGTGALTFDWNDNTLDGTEDPTGLSAGTYSVTVTDGAGCTATASVTLTDPAAIVLVCSEVSSPSTQGGADGSINLLLNGGTLPYLVSWTGPVTGMQTTNSTGSFPISNLLPGNYTILVRDDNGCESTCITTVPDTTGCAFSMSSLGIDLACNGNRSGQIQLIFTNITRPYNLTLTGPDQGTLREERQDTFFIFGLAAGQYTVLLEDAAGCTQSATITLTEPIPFDFTCQAVSNPTGPGLSDGIISVQLNGGGGIGGDYEILYDNMNGASGSIPATVGLNTLNNLLDSRHLPNHRNGCQWLTRGPVRCSM